MQSVKTIRAVERAFEVMRALERSHNGATLSELRAATALSGPTLLRLLKTLEAAQAVRRGLYDQRWRNSLSLNGLTRGMSAAERLADIAAARLDALCKLVQWPSDLAVHFGRDDFMTVLESTLRQSPFYVRRPKGAGRANLLMSALGTAYLAHLPPGRCRDLVRAARKGTDVHNRSAIAAGDLQGRLAHVRAVGYATRHPLYLGGRYNENARDDGTGSIAVPLLCRGVVYGAVNVNWNRRALSEEEMVTHHLAQLQQAAARIADEAWELGVFQAWDNG